VWMCYHRLTKLRRTLSLLDMAGGDVR
jgi:hypothetical protein